MSITQTSIWGPNPDTTRGCHTQIYLTKDGKKLSYGLHRNAIIRDVDNTGDFVINQEHLFKTSVVVISPSGSYVASGDESGKCRIWALTKTQNLKLEVPVFNGKIFDIAWGPENKRVVAVGAGRSTKAKAFMWDSGNSLGSVDKHPKTILSCSYKPNRPYRLATGGEDNYSNFFTGPPFKWKTTHKDHKNYVNCVRFSPDGSKYLSVSSDKRGIFWDGKTGDLLGELDVSEKHKGSIMACAWSPDGKQVATASADKTVKIWDVETYKLVKTLSVSDAPAVEDMQLGLDWKGDTLVSISLSGDLNFWSPEESLAPTRVVFGHQGPVKSMAYDAASGVTYTCSGAGDVLAWNPKGVATRLGKHTKPAEKLCVTGGICVSAGIDNLARLSDAGTGSMDGEVELEGGNPKCIAGCSGDAGLAIVGSTKGLTVMRGPRKVSYLAFADPLCIAISPDGKSVAVGRTAKPTVLSFFKLEADKLVADGVVAAFHYPVTAVAFSNNGEMFATADASREVKLFDTATRAAKVENFWQMHTSRVDCLEFSPNDLYLASAGVDSSIMLWDVGTKTKYIKGLSGHVAGGITALTWIDDNNLQTSGLDSTIRRFEVKFE